MYKKFSNTRIIELVRIYKSHIRKKNKNEIVYNVKVTQVKLV